VRIVSSIGRPLPLSVADDDAENLAIPSFTSVVVVIVVDAEGVGGALRLRILCLVVVDIVPSSLTCSTMTTSGCEEDEESAYVTRGAGQGRMCGRATTAKDTATVVAKRDEVIRDRGWRCGGILSRDAVCMCIMCCMVQGLMCGLCCWWDSCVFWIPKIF